MILGNLFGVSGNEAPVINHIKSMVGGETDKVGNLIVRKPGKGKKLAVVCPVDEDGLFVTDISGKIRFALIGKPDNLVNRTVEFENGVKGVICGDKADAKASELYIVADGEVSVGDIARFSLCEITNSDTVTGFSAERELCAKALLSVMDKIKDTELDVTYVFSVMYRIGKRGLNGFLFSEKPDYTIVIDTVCGDNVKCGDGAVVKVTEGSYTADERLHVLAREKKLKMTVSKDAELRTVNSAILGAPAGYVSIPVEKNCGLVTGCISDVQKCAELVCEVVQYREK